MSTWSELYLANALEGPQLASYKHDDNVHYLVFGSYLNPIIYHLDINKGELQVFDRYPNKFKPYYHCCISYKNKYTQKYHVLSFGGEQQYQHFYDYQIMAENSLNKWFEKSFNKQNLYN